MIHEIRKVLPNFTPAINYLNKNFAHPYHSVPETEKYSISVAHRILWTKEQYCIHKFLNDSNQPSPSPSQSQGSNFGKFQ